MTRARVVVIINPIAGRRGHRSDTARERRDLARAWFHRRALAADIFLTTGPGHAADLARRAAAEHVDRVIAWGGDGTINEVAGPLIGSTTALGIVPGGSGDGFAGGLGLPMASDAALDVAIDASPRPFDVGWLGERHFLNAGGVGFDAVVAHAFSARQSRGFAGYLVAGLRSVFSYRSITCTLDLDGHLSTGPRFLIAFGNGRQYGNGFVLAPDADPTDGWLDAVVVTGGSAIRQAWRGRRMFVAPEKPAEGVERRRIREARISCDTSLMAHVDGEAFVASSPIAVRVRPQALRVAAPERPAAG